MHSIIERFLWNKTINVPAVYYGICRDARRNPNKYDVRYLNHSSFKNFKKIQFFKGIHLRKKKGDPKVIIPHIPKKVTEAVETNIIVFTMFLSSSLQVTDLRAIKCHADGQVSSNCDSVMIGNICHKDVKMGLSLHNWMNLINFIQNG